MNDPQQSIVKLCNPKDSAEVYLEHSQISMMELFYENS